MYTKFEILPMGLQNSKSTQQAMEASNPATWSTDGNASKHGRYYTSAQGGQLIWGPLTD